MISPSNPKGVIAPTSPADILRAARAKIDTPEKWTRNALARNEKGRSVNPESKKAVCYCSLGAIHSVTPSDAISVAVLRAKQFLREAIGSQITPWNDEHDHSAILSGFDRAIALAEQERDALARRLIAEVVQENAAGQS